jgi:hypothetical protein
MEEMPLTNFIQFRWVKIKIWDIKLIISSNTPENIRPASIAAH